MFGVVTVKAKDFVENNSHQGMVVHVFNSCTLWAEVDGSEFKATVVYRVSSKPAKTT